MLASTVQFSNNDRQPLLINPANTEQTQHREHPTDAETEMARERNTLQRDKPFFARPLRTQQRTYGSPPITSPFQLTPTKEWATTTPKDRSSHVVLDTHDKQTTELVSVPPVSTTAEQSSA